MRYRLRAHEIFTIIPSYCRMFNNCLVGHKCAILRQAPKVASYVDRNWLSKNSSSSLAYPFWMLVISI